MKVTNEMQLYRLIYYSWSALHVSGDVFAHHQEHLTVFTASDSIQPNSLPAGVMDEFQLIHDTSRQRLVVDTTRCCIYSQVLLMMDENIARNK
jgi:hypothetical protein